MSGHVQSFLVEELGEQEQAAWLERGNAERGCSLAKAQSTLCVRSLPERLGERRKQVDAALDFPVIVLNGVQVFLLMTNHTRSD